MNNWNSSFMYTMNQSKTMLDSPSKLYHKSSITILNLVLPPLKMPDKFNKVQCFYIHSLCVFNSSYRNCLFSHHQIIEAGAFKLSCFSWNLIWHCDWPINFLPMKGISIIQWAPEKENHHTPLSAFVERKDLNLTSSHLNNSLKLHQTNIVLVIPLIVGIKFYLLHIAF